MESAVSMATLIAESNGTLKEQNARLAPRRFLRYLCRMPWLIIAEDSPEAAAARANRAAMDAHWAYEQSIRHRILAAGSLRSDDGTQAIGSLLILDVETRDEALALVNADPATKAGLRHIMSVRRWNMAIFGGEVQG
jgi:uncharacterized protein